MTLKTPVTELRVVIDVVLSVLTLFLHGIGSKLNTYPYPPVGTADVPGGLVARSVD